MTDKRYKAETGRALWIFLFCIGATAYSIREIFTEQDGNFNAIIVNHETLSMLVQLLILFVLLILFAYKIKRQDLRIAAYLLVLGIFLWMHRIFLPILVSFGYCLFLILTGWLVNFSVLGNKAVSFPGYKKTDEGLYLTINNAAHGFLSGASVYIICICLLSVFKLGSLKNIRIFTVLMALAVGFFFVLLVRKGRISLFRPEYITELPAEGRKEQEINTGKKKFCIVLICFITVLLMLQAGRMNMCADYDSVHYGLRSNYVLTGAGGIYENFGLVNDVYVYPKGLEVLALPLNASVTFSFVLALSWWMTVFTILLIYAVTSAVSSKEAGLCAAWLACCIPGITNMSVSAKTDAITCTFQLMFIMDTVLYLLEKKQDNKETDRRNHIVWALAALVLTLTFKPTSYFFSALLLFSAVLCLFVIKVKAKRKEHSEEAKRKEHSEEAKSSKKSKTGKGNMYRMFCLLIAPILALGGITARTLVLTGYPITSVFSGILKKLGFTGLYPYAFSYENYDRTSGMTQSLDFSEFLRRIKNILFSPTGEDMKHVIIAWGTVLVPLLIAVTVFYYRKNKNEKSAHLFLYATLFIQLAADAYALNHLYQVDGNYFMLTYCLVCICAMIFVTKDREQEILPLCFSLLPAAIFAVLITVMTSWSDQARFTPVAWLHKGFYDHASDVYDEMSVDGKLLIYTHIQAQPYKRVTAFAEQPECFLFPCTLQSYTDIEGSAGNVALVSTLENFENYLDAAGTNYIYAEDDFLLTHDRAKELITYMLEDGKISPVLEQGGNRLYEYN